MSDEAPSAYKPRSALGDVTNQVGKRGFSFVSTPGVQSGDGRKNDAGIQLAKKECLRIDNFKKENSHKEIPESVLRPHSCSQINSLKENISKISCETYGGKNTTSSALKSGDAVSVRDSCVIPRSPSDRNDPLVTIENERSDSVFVPQNASKEKMENSLGMDDGDDDTYLDCSKLPESQESRCGLERCIGQKGDEFSGSMDSIKACPCSFCMKAAYLWSDLHYQDMKGRIAAIKKSQKEASILVQQNRYGQGNSEKFSNLESDLTGRWMSLFVHMEDIFVREGTQLETSLSILKELRDNCKADSEEQ